MTKELVIAANAHETKVAVLEDDQLVEIYFQRANEYSLAGSVHKGRVTRVLPGMQSAFVDLGLDRDTFLYVSDFFEESEEYEKLPPGPEEKPSGRQQQPRQVAAAPTVVPAPAEGAPPLVPSAGVAPAGTEPRREGRGERGDRGGDRGGDRDRGGRRGRRRRGRGGRGFPETKFAEGRTPAAAGSEAAGAPPAAEGVVEAAPAATAEDFAVLPGESLRKYTRTDEPESEPYEPEVADGDDDEPAGIRAEAEPPAEPARQAAAPVAAAADTVDIGSVEEAREAIPDSVLDQLQARAEASLNTPVIEEEPAEEAEPAAAAEEDAAEEDAVEEEAAEGEAEEAGDEELSEEEIAEATAGVKVSEGTALEGEEGPEPALASMESLGSSHREQTARFRGRRMRRRRGNGSSGAGEVRTVAREGGPGERKEKPAGEPGERQGRGERGERQGRGERSKDRPQQQQPSISELLKEGQEIVVQIAKEPLGQKGARITSHIALPGRYCVYMPTVEHLGVSRKIASDEERGRLRRILQKHREGIPGGFIIRTAGEGKTEEQIASDIQYLAQLWQEIKQKADNSKSPSLLYHDVAIVQRLLRDQLTENFKAIWVDNEELYEGVVRFVQRMQPSMVSRIKLYTRTVPIFDAFNITSELEKALRPKVWLKSGGYIVINQTEALVAIDINTGKYVGKSNRLEDTIVKTNIDACKEIVRQIRLRDLGGIIVVDFIDMDERKNRMKVMQALEEAIRGDRAPNKIIPFNEFGLVAITRKRVKQSLERALCTSCPTCEGSGWVKSVQTVVGEILVEAAKYAPHVDGKEVMLRVHPAVAAQLKSKETSYLEELEGLFKRPVLVTSDETLHPEKFDLA